MSLNLRFFQRIPTKLVIISCVVTFLFILVIYGSLLPLMEEELLWSRKNSLKALVGSVHTLMNEYHQRVMNGEIALEEAQQRVLTRVHSMRYLNNDYFWINDSQEPYPVMIMHPTMPELNGMLLDDPRFNRASRIQFEKNGRVITFPNRDKNLFQAFVEVTRENGEGYVRYDWGKPTAEGVTEELYPKESFVRMFQPWGWIVGTGLYIDDIEIQMAQLRWKVFAAVLVILFLVLAMTFGMLRTITPPLGALMRYTNAVAQGHLDTSIEGKFSGELLQLKQSAEKMVQALKHNIEEAIQKKEEADREAERSRKSEEAVRKMDAFLSKSQEIAHLGSWELDLKTNRLTWSHEVFRILGFQPREIEPTYETFLEAIHPEDRAAVDAAYTTSIREGKDRYEIEHRIIRKHTGEIRHIREKCEHQRDASGHIIGSIGMIHDITEQKLAESVLRESEERYRSLFENNHAAMLLIAPEDGAIVDANPAACAYYGWSREQLCSMQITQINTLSQDEIKQELERAHQAKQNRFEFRHRLADGTIRDVEVFSGSIRMEDRDLLYSIIHDITEQKRAEMALSESRRLLRDILDTVPVRVFWKDRKLQYLGCNMPFARDAGLNSPDELIGKDDYQMSWREQADLYRADDRKVMESGQPKLGFEEPQTKPDGSQIWLRTSKVPLRDAGGNVFGILGTYEDITEQKRAEQEHERLQSLLQQSQKLESVGRLAGGVAHDFNNMLQAILGYAELTLNESELPDSLRESLLQIHKAAQRSADLTSQLLAFARRQTIAPRVLNLNETVEGMLKMLRRLIGEDIDLVWRPGADLWLIQVDPAQLDQVLANLCVNARDAIAGLGRITIETENVVLDDAYCAAHADFIPGSFVRLTVSDDGCGIDKEDLAHIFEPFFTTKSLGKGTGLGLATIYGIVRQNEGFINAYSEPGKGSSFKIYLPRYTGEKEAHVTPTEAVPPREGNETILLVEDEITILTLGKKMLEALGYTVLATNSPGEALRLAEQHGEAIHLLITDVIMPEMTGRELAERLNSQYPNLKILFMSGYTANVIAHHGVLDQGVHFMQKPFTVGDLATKVWETLNRGG